MKKRAVFSAADMSEVREAMHAARSAGIANDDISLIARADIERENVPEDRKVGEGDFYPAAVKGALGGGAVGLLGGLAAVVVAPFGITVAGVLGLALAGASLGTWSSALAGSTVPDPVRREFEDEIAKGRILIVIDGEEEDTLPAAITAVSATRAVHLPFDRPTVMT
ncbi:hypothetical protein [Dyella sp.]|uniref:hypothetical protein n=1 Tax=Dyella sp. TaxID=1869338 RepID=UPI002D7A0867|nr:hypothetical protein [Dyella sp.]HET6432795.1 hypothetical protein [Dyella sp.]